jgi:hypothetical protein
MSAPRLVRREDTSPAELVPLREQDIAEVASFIAAQSSRGRETVESRLGWFLLENPARDSQEPLGFGLRSAGRLVGCILCSPQIFCFENEKVRMMGSSSFYVDESHRGYGGRIFLKYLRLGNQWPLFGTSANADAAALWKAAGAHPIAYSEGELFGILRWRPVAEEFVHRRTQSPILSRWAGSSLSGLARIFHPLKIDYGAAVGLRPLTSAEEVIDLLAKDRSPKITAMRDLSYIRWRYFCGRDRTVEVFTFRSRQPDREILVTVNQRTRGYRGQINTLNLLDVYPEVCPDEWLRIVGALIPRYQKLVDAIVLRGQDSARSEMFCKKGFQWRAFDAPNGWLLDKAKLLPARDWYPVPADGDGLI